MKVVTFGEIMLRLMPENYLRFVQADKFEATYAGAEANVAVSLANFGNEAVFVSKVPAGEIGQAAVNAVRKYGVNSDYIVRGGNRLGVYFCEKGASQRPSKVIYDRAGSSFACADKDDFDWKEIFKYAEWFHFTGITPALSDSVAGITRIAAQTAKENGLTVSCDLNYRKKLWSNEKAKATMSEILPFVDYCIANEEDMKDVFGIETENNDVTGGNLNKAGYVEAAKELSDMFGLKGVAVTLRESKSANDNDWSAMLYTGGKAYFSRKYSMHIVDRVGGGDSFGGALIHALLKNGEAQYAIDFAVAASCLKHSIQGDFNLVTESEVSGLMKGDSTGRVQR
ncbi:MAG: sugar kinase [Candidatus Borkfalkiaceae bacterium]|nr:sugar kinase [Christensenellaceae bacterium]